MTPDPIDNAPVRFSTDDVPERERVAMLRERFGRTLFRLDIEPLPDVPFRCALTMHALPGVGISSAFGGGMRAGRTRELMTDARDDLLLAINLKGPTVITQRGREFVIGEQAATLATLGETGRMIRPTLDHHLHILSMPRAAIAPLVRHAERAVMRPIPPDSQALRLLIKYVAVVQEDDAELKGPLRQLAASHIHHLVAATIGATPEAMEAARSGGIRAARLATIRADVLANLSDPKLSARTVGHRHGISDRYVHLLFAETGQSFGGFVEEQRLQRAFALLTDPTHVARRISEIGTSVGFAEHPGFDRAFRRRFGDAPSAVRRGRTR
jgi:AraC-like DNA-binding protein